MELTDWVGIALVVGVAFSVILLKFIIIRCYAAYCRDEATRRAMCDAETGLRRESFLGPSVSLLLISDPQIYFSPSSSASFHYHSRHHAWSQVQRQGGSRKPPPTFEKALKCSSPVSFIEMDDGPPPTYQEYLAMQKIPETHNSSRS